MSSVTTPEKRGLQVLLEGEGGTPAIAQRALRRCSRLRLGARATLSRVTAK